MDKTKEEFVQFIRHATQDPSSNEYIELYQFLMGCFIRADADMDGQVSKSEFDVMIDEAAALTIKHGLAPKLEDQFPNDAARKEARAKQFKAMDSNGDGSITFEEWLSFALADIKDKIKGLSKDLLSGKEGTKEEFVAFVKKTTDKTSPEFRELYYFLVKCFVDADKDRDGAIQQSEFDQMIEVAAAAPRRHGLAPTTASLYKTDADRQAARAKEFKDMDSNGDGNISYDEWLGYCFSHIIGKVASL